MSPSPQERPSRHRTYHGVATESPTERRPPSARALGAPAEQAGEQEQPAKGE